ncbi:amino acid adenylation domain-containing protein [Actinomadura sp. 9N215]|uniref:amino acid adenylation domain-containing protein n=1 Tax=Actinomadura sp. 9N215 TaxID=3375150 RepID=UPI003792B43C
MTQTMAGPAVPVADPAPGVTAAHRMIPRWRALDAPAAQGWGHHEVLLPAGTTAALERVAAERGHALEDLLLAAHLKVLGVLSQEREVVSGYVPHTAGERTSGTVLRCTVADGTWAELTAAAVAAAGARTRCTNCEATLDLSCLDRPRGDEPRTAGGLWHLTVLRDDTVLSGDRELLLRARHRLDLIDRAHAERLLGYFRTALVLLAREFDRPHDRHVLLPQEEIHAQVDGLAGPAEPAPGASFDELFRRQAADRPDATAARHGDLRWSYRDLDAAADRVAGALLRSGVAPEDVVAVVMDRHLDWLAAIIGVLRCGGVYLPVRPDFPAERVAAQLRRSRCRHALADAPGAEALAAARAVAGEECALVTPSGDDATPRDLDAVRPDGLAYVYFTSGSTGEPKGAMCEHAGLVNHLFAKIADMGVGPGDVVAQTASQCFDISLWQAIAPLAVGASTYIVDTGTLLEPDRFIAEVAARGVHVLQLVPSYLDTLLSHVDRHPVDLGAVRSVSVTGEALKYELVRRWFARFPGITLVNAYGATEVCDDTMHEVLSAVPERDFVPVGRPLRNVRAYIVDDRLRPVPLGSPGEIVFAGMSVGRGYINDPERTGQAFVSDPHHPGERMYRTGDYGRWLPEGKIEYLGRRDEQVKIRGFRIEIGEIESRMLAIAGVREATVVIVAGEGRDAGLVAFFSGEPSVDGARLRDRLAEALPEYMLPAYCHRLERLPLNENGKVDKRSLTALAAALGHADAPYAAPRTDAEMLLATAWAEVLGVPLEHIGRDDDFFGLGGTSLAAVRLVVKADRRVSLQQIMDSPVLRDLAAEMERPGGDGAGGAGGTAGRRMLQRLTAPDGTRTATLVCVPYAGGNAINFQALARELRERDPGVEVYGVELPGHDFADGRPETEVAEIAGILRDEIAALGTGPIVLWGHDAGAALAVGVARLLEDGRHDVRRVFLGAPPRLDAERIGAESAAIAAQNDQEIVARLRDASAFVMLDHLNHERVALVAAAVRQDVGAAGRFLRAAVDRPGEHRLRGRIDLVTAADDARSPDAAEHQRSWLPLAELGVCAHVIDQGGHYFVRTQAAQVARIIRAALDDPTGG